MTGHRTLVIEIPVASDLAPFVTADIRRRMGEAALAVLVEQVDPFMERAGDSP